MGVGYPALEVLREDDFHIQMPGAPALWGRLRYNGSKRTSMIGWQPAAGLAALATGIIDNAEALRNLGKLFSM